MRNEAKKANMLSSTVFTDSDTVQCFTQIGCVLVAGRSHCSQCVHRRDHVCD